MGMIELQTYDWIAGLQKDDLIVQLAHRSKFRDRVDIAKKMVQRLTIIEDDEKTRIIELWSPVLPHSETRNLVAHSCVMMWFPNDDPGQPAANLSFATPDVLC